MPVAGDEGYEKLIICPYDRAHEIRKGRMQFHLEKCRKNFPLSQLVDCPHNKSHIVPRQELAYHVEEECDSRAGWDRFTHELSNAQCPVRDLVPVNAATVPDGDENWDNFETSGSVLQHIKAEAENKPIFRLCQVASKATRKAFRQQERIRHGELKEAEKSGPKVDTRAMSDTASVISDNEPLRRPKKLPNYTPIVKQDPSKAVAAIQKQFRTLDVNMKSPDAEVPPSETSSMVNGPPSVYAPSTSRQVPFSYAAASRASTSRANAPGAGSSSEPMMTVLTTQRATLGNAANRPSSAMSDMSTASSSMSMMSALTNQQVNNSRPPTALSSSTFNSYATAPQSATINRAASVISDTDSSVSSMVSGVHRPPNSSICRPSAAMNIAASAAAFNRAPPGGDGFCQVPIPGLGRGKRRPVQ